MKHWVTIVSVLAALAWMCGCDDNAPPEETYSKDLDGIGVVRVHDIEPDPRLGMNPPRTPSPGQTPARRAGEGTGEPRPGSTPTTPSPDDPRVQEVRRVLSEANEDVRSRGREAIVAYMGFEDLYQQVVALGEEYKNAKEDMERAARSKGVSLPEIFDREMMPQTPLPDEDLSGWAQAEIRFVGDLALVYLPGERMPLPLRNFENLGWRISVPVPDPALERRLLEAMAAAVSSKADVARKIEREIEDGSLTSSNAGLRVQEIKSDLFEDALGRLMSVGMELGGKVIPEARGQAPSGPPSAGPDGATPSPSGPSAPSAPTGDPRIQAVRSSLEKMHEAFKEDGPMAMVDYTRNPGLYSEILEIVDELEESKNLMRNEAQAKGISIPQGYIPSMSIDRLIPTEGLSQWANADIRFAQDVALVRLQGRDGVVALHEAEGRGWLLGLPVTDRGLEERMLEATLDLLEGIEDMAAEVAGRIQAQDLTTANAQQRFELVRQDNLTEPLEKYMQMMQEFRQKALPGAQGAIPSPPSGNSGS